MEEFREITKIGRDKAYECLKSFIALELLKSYEYGKNGINIYKITLEKKRIAKIMDILSD